MLDYDAMRAKVKKLTEKPDKDPAKLPRTEKETEMVGAQRSSFDDPMSSASSNARNSKDDYESDPDLEMLSPPKALQRPEIQKLKQAQRPVRTSSMQFGRSPSLISHGTEVRSRTSGTARENRMMQQNPPTITRSFIMGSEFSNACSDGRRLSSEDEFILETPSKQNSRPVSLPAPPSPDMTCTPDQQSPRKIKTRSMASSRSSLGRARSRGCPSMPSPFFNPSELEELMAPLKRDFVQRQADICVQAKAAYEQLNEQLTSELPQLIDLR